MLTQRSLFYVKTPFAVGSTHALLILIYTRRLSLVWVRSVCACMCVWACAKSPAVVCCFFHSPLRARPVANTPVDLSPRQCAEATDPIQLRNWCINFFIYMSSVQSSAFLICYGNTQLHSTSRSTAVSRGSELLKAACVWTAKHWNINRVTFNPNGYRLVGWLMLIAGHVTSVVRVRVFKR